MLIAAAAAVSVAPLASMFPLNALAAAGEKSGSKQLEAFVKSAVRASGHFSQVVIGKDGKKVDGPLEGDFAFMRPGRFVWNVKTPYPQRIVSDAKSIYIWDPDLNQVTIKRLTSALSSTPASILFGEADIDASFELKDLPAAEGLVWVRATPRVEDLTYAAIELGFDAKGRIAAMRLKDHFGQTTALTLTDLEINGGMDEKQFAFTIPEGADVLKDDNGA